MTSLKSIEILYNIINLKHGNLQAKSGICAMLRNILDDLESEGVEISEKNISERLQKYTQDFAEATKSDVA